MVTRFSPNDLSPKYDYARLRLAQAALTPSKIFNDTAAWVTLQTPTSRAIYIAGFGTDAGKYRLETRASLTPPTRPGDTRHVVTLDQLPQLGESVYRWDTRVDLAVGSVTAEEISILASMLLTAAEGRGERELRDDYRAAFPRATAAFGHGFTIDSILATPGSFGSTNVSLTASFRPELMEARYPLLAKYLNKYLGPAKYHFVLSDPHDGVLFEVVGADRSLTARYRVHKGKLTSLVGTPHPWGDSLQLTSDVSLKVKLFRVGFTELMTDFVISNVGHDRAWTITARREPKWNLPLFTESLIRSPLRRPFEGQGSMFRLSVRDTAGGQTVFSRRTRLDVQESAIMRFLGGLSSHVVGELDSQVEAEEDRFLRDGFIALQQDLKTLVGRWK
ncbi:MAG TPA: hypothetical protein VIP11_00445 [Gemmatimonadaceae bacterium]